MSEVNIEPCLAYKITKAVFALGYNMDDFDRMQEAIESVLDKQVDPSEPDLRALLKEAKEENEHLRSLLEQAESIINIGCYVGSFDCEQASSFASRCANYLYDNISETF